MIEGANALATGKLESLSEQVLLDCATNGNLGCDGGFPARAAQWVVDNGGIPTESHYEHYTPEAFRCDTNRSAITDVHINKVLAVDKNEEALQAAVETEVVGLSVDYTYLYVLSALAETAVMVEDDGCARVLYERMLPYSGDYVNLFLGPLQLGSVSRYLGRLALTFGEPGMAGYHFAHAADANRATGSHLWLAHTRLDWATALSGQGHAARVEARELLRPCLAESRERGLKRIARRAAELLDDLRE